MEPIIITEKFIAKEKVDELNNISLKDNFKYEKIKDGIQITGDVEVKGILFFDEGSEELKKKINVDVLVPLYRVDKIEEVKLIIEDFSYVINDKMITFTVKLRLKGENVEKIKFEKNDKKAKVENFDAILNENDTMMPKREDPSFMDEFQKYIQNKDVEVITTLETEGINNEGSFNDEIVNYLDIPNTNRDEILDINESKEIPLPVVQEEPFPIEVKKEEKQELSKPSEKKENSSVTLLNDEYVSSYFFYRMRKEDTIDTICEKFKTDKTSLLEKNNHVEFIEDQLILIPR